MQRCYLRSLFLPVLIRSICVRPLAIMPLERHFARFPELYRRSRSVLERSRNISESIGLQEGSGTLYRPSAVCPDSPRVGAFATNRRALPVCLSASGVQLLPPVPSSSTISAALLRRPVSSAIQPLMVDRVGSGIVPWPQTGSCTLPSSQLDP